jgi:hypothetical protein
MGAREKRSKKRSGTRAEQLLEDTTFFTDECLGHEVPESLRAAGLKIEQWDSHFAPGTEDFDWLSAVGRAGWAVLTKDKAIRKKPWEMQRVVSCGIRLFTLPNGKMTAAQMTEVFLENRLRMARLLHRLRHPFIAVVSRSGVNLVEGDVPDEPAATEDPPAD